MSKRRTVGERYHPAMEMTDQAQADTYFEELVSEHMSMCKTDGIEITREEAEKLERQWLGYFAGYYDYEVRIRVEKLFRCVHPVFGSIAEKGPPTAEQAFRAGLNMRKV